MRTRFLADADFNQKIVLGLRRREPAVDFEDARAGGVIGVLPMFSTKQPICGGF
jgi:hypothetical protein